MQTHAKIVYEQLEIDIYKIAAQNNLAPAFIHVFPLPNDYHGPAWSLITERFDSTLQDYLEANPELTATYMIEAHRLVSELHKLGFCHGYLHLGNFMVNATGELRLIDFGESFATGDACKNSQDETTILRLFPYFDKNMNPAEYLEHAELNYEFWLLQNGSKVCYWCRFRLCLPDLKCCGSCRKNKDR
jgi:serine/threonine protein kinase